MSKEERNPFTVVSDSDPKTAPIIADYDTSKLFSADPACKHEVIALWSGVKCRKCPGWFCL